jgi:hypothetical protein
VNDREWEVKNGNTRVEKQDENGGEKKNENKGRDT